MISDEMLRRSAAVSNELFLEYILQDYEREHAFSPAFEHKIKKLYRRAKHPYLYRAMHRAISILLAVLISGSIWLTFDTQARAAFFWWVRETYETFFVYRFSNDIPPSTEPAAYRPAWIPDGYSETSSMDISGQAIVIYENAQADRIRFSYAAPGAANWFFDMDSMEKHSAAVHGSPADLLISTDPGIANVIVWTSDKNYTAYYISGFLDEDELLRMAESISRAQE